ncbi:pyruvate dehydrogenase E1 component alpha subunit [Plasmodium ovale wallikeri]|uniref:Pyruvate dehydrogenase E1 component alpha subunit n=1 Tax=Plasmodium ovale wallikeri TaxID=864142 RepID=A0A1A8YUL4_PLAOA|nr:pyruvate dehydrogenase E1 component alpha subunit [Plasmodium ovale wallikeri]
MWMTKAGWLISLLACISPSMSIHIGRKGTTYFIHSNFSTGGNVTSIGNDRITHRTIKVGTIKTKSEEKYTKGVHIDENIFNKDVGDKKEEMRILEGVRQDEEDRGQFNIYVENNKLEKYLSDVKVTREEMCMLYEDMYMGRMFENMVAKLYYRKKVNGFVHLYNGQEGISSGIIKNLRGSDFVTSTYRDHVHAISKTVPPAKVLNELYGNYYGSTNGGKGGSMHIYSKEHNFIGGFGFIGEQIPIAVGLAFSILYKAEFASPLQGYGDDNTGGSSSGGSSSGGSSSGGSSSGNNHDGDDRDRDHHDVDVVVCFLGDGTTNMGQFFESLNLSSTYNLPIVFVIENNNWAIGMEGSRSSADDLMNNYLKGKAFNIDTYKVDGNDVLGIYKLAKKKITEIRKRKSGPIIIEAITYRTRGHSLADPDELRKVEEKTSWKKRDPILELSNYMKTNNIVDHIYFDNVKKYTQKILQDAEKDADVNSERSKNINICKLYKENIFAPSEFTSYKADYVQYGKFDELSSLELREYYDAFIKEMERKKINRKADLGEKFDMKHLPLIID